MAILRSQVMLRVSLAAILYALVAQASPLRMTLLLERDSFLPYEPIVARVTVVNVSDEDVPIPPLKRGIASIVLSYSIRAVDGTDIPDIRGPFRVTVSPPPRWGARVLAPGESVSVLYDIADHAGERDPESRGSYCFLPGQYSLGASWNLRILSSDKPWSYDTSNRLRFVVRSARGDEREALAIYRDIEYYSWCPFWKDSGEVHPLTGAGRKAYRLSRVVDLAQRLIINHPVEPYVIMAVQKLVTSYWGRVFGSPGLLTSPGGVSSLRDSMRLLYRSTISRYPHSSVAVDYLAFQATSSVLDDLDGPGANRAFLAELAAKYPDEPVGREAQRQLLAGDK